jgi:hypothetical protein
VVLDGQLLPAGAVQGVAGLVGADLPAPVVAAPRRTMPAWPPGPPPPSAAAQRPEVPPRTRSTSAPASGAQPARSRSKSPSASRLPGVGRIGRAAGTVVEVTPDAVVELAPGAVVAVVPGPAAVVGAGAPVVAGPAVPRDPPPVSRVSRASTAEMAARLSRATRNSCCSGDIPNRRGGSARCFGALSAMAEYWAGQARTGNNRTRAAQAGPRTSAAIAARTPLTNRPESAVDSSLASSMASSRTTAVGISGRAASS